MVSPTRVRVEIQEGERRSKIVTGRLVDVDESHARVEVEGWTYTFGLSDGRAFYKGRAFDIEVDDLDMLRRKGGWTGGARR